MRKFEYKTEVSNELNCSENGGWKETAYLNTMGRNGWELICVLDGRFGNSTIYYWKREIK